MQDSTIGRIVQAPTDLLVNPAERLRAGSRTGEGNGNRDVKKVAQEFESLFVTYLLKVMRETIEEAEPGASGSGKGIYTELFDQEFARGIAQQKSLGIADLVVKGLRSDSPEAPAIQPDRTSILR